jgi:hypothetical protein
MYNAAMRRAQTLGGAFDTAVNTMYERQQQQAGAHQTEYPSGQQLLAAAEPRLEPLP